MSQQQQALVTRLNDPVAAYHGGLARQWAARAWHPVTRDRLVAALIGLTHGLLAVAHTLDASRKAAER